MKIDKKRLYQIVFESDTKAGKDFDVILLWAILLSVLVALLDSVPMLNTSLKTTFLIVELVLTLLFTVEYTLRIYISPRPYRYIFSFWGIIDLLSILPTYLSLFLYGYHYLLVVRIFRLLRVFRIFKLVRFNREAMQLLNSLKSSAYKIGIFLSAVLAIVVLLGTVMYVIEDGENGFSSIPQSIYWAVITITTVGYGDIVPHTVLGKFVATVTMMIGYSIIAVPTGIVTFEVTKKKRQSKCCTRCNTRQGGKANYCSMCGEKFPVDDDDLLLNNGE